MPIPEPASQQISGLPRTDPPLIGRSDERQRISQLLLSSEKPLLTLTGPAGTGKTRLAIAIARDLVPSFSGGVVFVPLASVTDPDLVLPTIAQALGIWWGQDEPLISVLQSTLREVNPLLVLDNFEQVVSASNAISEIMRGCPRLKILVTSRVPLRLSGEQEYPVPPLRLPESNADPDFEEIAQSEAVRLFVQRARSVNPTFSLNESNAESVLGICRDLDGLPLAIELAAARAKMLPPVALRARLTNRLQLLTGGARDAPPRLRSMRDAIGWSYDLLDSSEQRLFRRLAIFVGGFTLEAAEAITNDLAWTTLTAPLSGVQSETLGSQASSVSGVIHSPGRDSEHSSTLEGISSLVDNSLLVLELTDGSDARFRMYETVREYGLEQLAAQQEDHIASATHARYFGELVERCHPIHLSGIRKRHHLDLLEREHDNVRAALRWLINRGEALELAGALGWFWSLHGHMNEGRAWIERALSTQLGPTSPRIRIRALFSIGLNSWEVGDFESSRVYLNELLSLSRSEDDKVGMAQALLNLGVIDEKHGDEANARRQYRESLTLFRAAGDHSGTINALINLGDSAFREGDLESSHVYTDEAITLATRIGELHFLAWSVLNSAQLHLARGELEAATTAYRRSIQLADEVGDRWLAADALNGMAGVAAAAGDPLSGAAWLGAARSMSDALGTPGVSHHGQLERSLAAVRLGLNEESFERAWSAGRTLKREAVIASAMTWAPPNAAALVAPVQLHPNRVNSAGLTDREIEVLRLLAEGLSTRDIGERLYISPRTAATHVSHVLGKLEVNSRSAAVAIAFQEKLV